MQIASAGGIDYPGLLKQLTAALKAASSVDLAVQEPTGSSLASATSAASKTITPALPSTRAGSGLLDSNTLTGLISVQDRTASGVPTSSARDPTRVLNQAFSDLEKLHNASFAGSSPSAPRANPYGRHLGAYAAAAQITKAPGATLNAISATATATARLSVDSAA